ncbi:MAG: pro-sigmaK processing inhibitor BofA family protein [Clostridia bacterium]|nr:pro-sigmaK processing inhibitor BofA family protein [Clostridia bacterium]
MVLPWSAVLAFCVGILLIWVFGRLFLLPGRWLWRLFSSALLGGLAIWAFNLIGPRWGLSIAVNPLTALCVGTLGLPGLGLMIALSSLL